MSIISKQLEIVTRFSKYIDMHFGKDKCTYIRNEKGTVVKSELIEINQLCNSVSLHIMIARVSIQT